MALYCSQCGIENQQDAVTCYHCQSPMARPDYGPGPYANAPQGYTAEGQYDPRYSDSGYTETGYSETDSGKSASGLSRTGSMFVGAICVLYLLNPTAGFDLIPDIFPIIGNLDEAGAMAGLLMALSNLGVIPYRRS